VNEVAENERLDDENGIDLVGLGLSNACVTQRRSLQGIDEGNLKAVFEKMSDNVLRVMGGRFKANEQLILGQKRKLFIKKRETCRVIFERERRNEDLTVGVDPRGYMG